jgi:hypothetical protein
MLPCKEMQLCNASLKSQQQHHPMWVDNTPLHASEINRAKPLLRVRQVFRFLSFSFWLYNTGYHVLLPKKSWSWKRLINRPARSFKARDNLSFFLTLCKVCLLCLLCSIDNGGVPVVMRDTSCCGFRQWWGAGTSCCVVFRQWWGAGRNA